MKASILTILAAMITAVAVVSAEESAISVSIAVPASVSGERAVQNRDRTSRFHVVVTNVSEKPQRLWQESCSWGYWALSFEFTEESGKKWTTKKRGMKPFTMNRPSFWSLDPHESLVLEVYCADTDTWEGFPVLKQGSKSVASVRAVFEIRSTPESGTHGVWTGRVVSDARQITFYRPEP